MKRMGVLLEPSRWASAVYNLFCWFHRVKGRIFPSLRKISAMLGCSERTVKRATAELVRLGMLWKTRRYRRSTEYSLTPPDGAQMALDFERLGVMLTDESSPLPLTQQGPVTTWASSKQFWPPGNVEKPEGAQDVASPACAALKAPCPHLGPTVVKPSLRSQRREVSVALVIFLKPVHARKPPRRQTALERASERFLREG